MGNVKDSSHTADVSEKQPVDSSSGSKHSSFEDTSNESGLVEGDYGSQGGHVFEDEKVADYWRGVYEKATYEGRHRFDPSVKWSAKEEKKLLRKVCFNLLHYLIDTQVCDTKLWSLRLIGESCCGLG